MLITSLNSFPIEAMKRRPSEIAGIITDLT
jgi:hypothetical protein